MQALSALLLCPGGEFARFQAEYPQGSEPVKARVKDRLYGGLQDGIGERLFVKEPLFMHVSCTLLKPV